MLGAQRDEAPYGLLAEAAGVDDRYGFEQSGAFRALAGTRRGEALDVLLDGTACGRTSNRARPAATQAAGVLGGRLERRARERALDRLVDLLRDPIDRVRTAAVGGLAALGEPAAIPALEAYARTLSDQEAVAVRRALAAVRAKARPAEPAKEKALDDLRQTVRRLEERLGRLEAREAAKDEA